MAEPGESDIDWDETVDVLCVGDGPGALAYGILCTAADLDVLIIECAELDPQTRDWHSDMTADLDGGQPDACLSLMRAEPVPVQPINDRTKLEPFVGEHLRQWSAGCLASPFGVMFTQIPELLVPMRTAGGESITAALLGDFPGDRAADDLVAWLWDYARELGVAETENHMAAMRFEGGRAAGIELDDGYLLATSGGFALPVGPETSHPDLPDVSGEGYAVAIMGRPAGRFATVDLIAR